MVVIRLARTGKKKQAFYRVVVADSKRSVTAKFISIVGWYNPHSKEIDLKKEQIEEWLKKGAVPSNTVAELLKKEGIKLPDWVKITQKVKKAKKTEEKVEKPAEAPKAAEESAEENAEASKEESAQETPAAEEVEVAEDTDQASEADAEVSAE